MRVILLLFMFSFVSVLHAADSLEIMALKHRLPEQVLPALRPLLDAGGSMTSASGKLIVRTSPENLAQIRQALAGIDTPLRRVVISVRQGNSDERSTSTGGLSVGRVFVGPNGVSAHAQGGLSSNTTRTASSLFQQVQTVEGGEASIFIGRSLPIPMRQVIIGSNGVAISESVRMVDLESGFRARPELVGGRVKLTLAPQSQHFGSQGIETSSLSTTIEGRLGEWISLGGSDDTRQSDTRGTLATQAADTRYASGIWLKVDALDE